MTKETKQDLIEALAMKTLFDFIANDGWKLSKDELIDLLKEVIYSATEHTKNEDHLMTAIFENIRDNTSLFEEGECDA